MCNSLSLPIPPSTDKVVCSNTSILPQYSIGKILPRDTPAKQAAVYHSGAAAHTVYSAGKTLFPRNGTTAQTPAAQAPAPEQITTIADLRHGQNLATSKLPFLWKLHILLDDVEATGNDHIVSWLVHGRSFKVYRPKSFIAMIAPHYFKQSKFKSFQRQLHLYEFTRMQYGPEAGSYSHPLFVRGEPHLCLSLSPIKIKGKAGRQQRQAVAAAVAQRSANNAYHTTAPTPAGKRARSPADPDLPATAVLSKREQEEWVAKIQRMVVKGSALAAEMKQQQQHQEQERYQHQEQQFQPLAVSSSYDWENSQHVTDDDDEDTCSLFGANFHLLPQQESVSSCEHCCESDTEDEADWNPILLESE